MHGKRRDAGTRDYLYVLGYLILKYEREAGHEVNATRLGAADLIRFLLEQRLMSARSLAEKLKIPRAALYAMLNGRSAWSDSAIAKLSRHFKLNRDFFLR